MNLPSPELPLIKEIVAAALKLAEVELELPGKLKALLESIQSQVGPGLLRAEVSASETGVMVPLASIGLTRDWAPSLPTANGVSAGTGSESEEAGLEVDLILDSSCTDLDREELAREILKTAQPLAETHYADPLGKLNILLGQAEGPVSRMATASAHFFNMFRKYTWVGFYMLGDEPDVLKIGPYCGFPTCTGLIPVERGMCGKSFTEDRVLNIPDIAAAEGYIACHGSTISELVIPVKRGGATVGVFDLDSDIRGAFTKRDEALLSEALELIFPD